MHALSQIPTPTLLRELKRREHPATSPEADAIPGAKNAAPGPLKKLPPLVATALQVVERVFQIEPEQVLGHSREEHLVKARFCAWLLLADQGVTRREIARAFHRQDVGTIRHGCLRGRELVTVDKAFARAMWNAYHELQRRTQRMMCQPHHATPPTPLEGAEAEADFPPMPFAL